MFQLKYAILAIFTLYVLHLTLFDKKKIAVQILFFFIPFFANPFRDKGIFFLLGLNAFLVWAIWIGQTLRNVIIKKEVSWCVLSPRLRVLYYFLFVGIILAVSRGNSPDLSFSCHHSLNQSLLNFSLYIITIILFLKIMVEYRYDYNFQDRLCLILILTTFFQFGSFLSYSFGLTKFLPAFLSSPPEYAEGFYRFTGLLGDYELIVDYVAIVICLALIFIHRGKHKIISLISIVIGGVIGVLSGTRSFFVVCALFMFFLSFLYVIKFKLSRGVIKSFFISVVAIIAIGVFVIKFVPNETIFKRFEDSVYYFKKGKYEKSFNRDLGKAIPIVVRHTGFWGNGSMIISAVDRDVMVFHNLYLAVYSNYGVVGLLALIFLLGGNILRLQEIINRSSDKRLINNAIIFQALLFSLLFQQMKISAIRSISILLLYTFIFLLIHFNYLQFKEQIRGKPGN